MDPRARADGMTFSTMPSISAKTPPARVSRRAAAGNTIPFHENSSRAGVEGCLEGLELLLQAIRQGLQDRSAGLPSNAVIAGS